MRSLLVVLLVLAGCSAQEQQVVEQRAQVAVSQVHGAIVEAQSLVDSVSANKATVSDAVDKLATLSGQTGKLHDLATLARNALENGDLETASSALKTASEITAPLPDPAIK